MITAVFGDALLDPATGETAREAVVLIEDGRVTTAGGRNGRTQVPRDAEQVDAEGLTLLPGLIDCHVHLTNLGEGLDFARELTTPPTLVAPHWVIRHAEAGKMPAYAITKARAVIDDHKASIRQAIESGVKIAFGTVTGVGPHGSNGEEFLLMRELGMEPIDCIGSATTVAADTIGMKGVGRLEAGGWGDVIGVPGDPLGDLSLLAKPGNIRLVIKGGEVVKRA